jgi:hypothetical protein
MSSRSPVGMPSNCSAMSFFDFGQLDVVKGERDALGRGHRFEHDEEGHVDPRAQSCHVGVVQTSAERKDDHPVRSLAVGTVASDDCVVDERLDAQPGRSLRQLSGGVGR